MTTIVDADSFPESFEATDDGDERTAELNRVPYRALGDRTRYLFNRRVLATYELAYSNEGAAVAGLPPTSVWRDFPIAGPNVFYIDVPSVVANDVLAFDCSSSLSFVANGGDDQSFVRVAAYIPPALLPEDVIVIPGASSFSELRDLRFPFSIKGRMLAAQTATYRIALQGRTRNGDPGEITLFNSFSLRVLHLKRTPSP